MERHALGGKTHKTGDKLRVAVVYGDGGVLRTITRDKDAAARKWPGLVNTMGSDAEEKTPRWKAVAMEKPGDDAK